MLLSSTAKKWQVALKGEIMKHKYEIIIEVEPKMSKKQMCKVINKAISNSLAAVHDRRTLYLTVKSIPTKTPHPEYMKWIKVLEKAYVGKSWTVNKKDLPTIRRAARNTRCLIHAVKDQSTSGEVLYTVYFLRGSKGDTE